MDWNNFDCLWFIWIWLLNLLGTQAGYVFDKAFYADTRTKKQDKIKQNKKETTLKTYIYIYIYLCVSWCFTLYTNNGLPMMIWPCHHSDNLMPVGCLTTSSLPLNMYQHMRLFLFLLFSPVEYCLHRIRYFVDLILTTLSKEIPHLWRRCPICVKFGSLLLRYVVWTYETDL